MMKLIYKNVIQKSLMVSLSLSLLLCPVQVVYMCIYLYGYDAVIFIVCCQCFYWNYEFYGSQQSESRCVNNVQDVWHSHRQWYFAFWGCWIYLLASCCHQRMNLGRSTGWTTWTYNFGIWYVSYALICFNGRSCFVNVTHMPRWVQSGDIGTFVWPTSRSITSFTSRSFWKVHHYITSKCVSGCGFFFGCLKRFMWWCLSLTHQNKSDWKSLLILNMLNMLNMLTCNFPP